MAKTLRRIAKEGTKGFYQGETADLIVAEMQRGKGLITHKDLKKYRPKKRMLSSMSPTIVMKNGKNFLVAGSPDGSRIITTTLQVVMNVIDHRLNVQAAVNAPRIHHQWLPDEIRIEQGLSLDTIRLLQGMGHTVTEKSAMGAIQSIMIDAGTVSFTAGPIREGAPRRPWDFS